MYNKGYFKSFKFETYTINIGNLRMGGTGKTPHVDYLISLFSNIYNIVVLSRGYKRKRQGLIFADSKSKVSELGDEAMQIYRKHGRNIRLCVCKSRKLALETIEKQYPDTNLILLDDAFQHRKVQTQLNILLTTYDKPFFKDAIFPVGMLRESKHNGRRADAVIVTKCPKILSQSEQNDFKMHLKPYLKAHTPVFFSLYKYNKPQSLFNNRSLPDHRNIILMTGIAQVNPLINHLKDLGFAIEKFFKFEDHVNYTVSRIQKLSNYYYRCQLPVYILTTEKDAVKLLEFRTLVGFRELPIFYLPIGVYFENRDFEKFLNKKLPKP